jgi:MFS family permease
VRAISYVLVIREGTFAALRTPTYRRYWLGVVCYVLGHRAEYVTYAWMMWQLTESPMYLGYLGLAQGVPLFVFQLVGGVLADRVNRLRLLLVTQVCTSITLTLAFVLTFLGIARVEHLLVLAALSNVFRAFDEPSRMSLIPQLVDRSQLSNAITLGSIPWQAGRMIGPSITGLLIAAFSGTAGFALAMLASYGALVMYSGLKIRGEARAVHSQNAFGQFVEGLGFVGANFAFTCLIGLALMNSLFGISYMTLLPVYADKIFGAGSTGYGLLQAAHGGGALIGTLTLASIAHLIRRPGTALLVGAVGLGVELMVFSRMPHLGLALPVLMTVGFCNTFYLTQINTLLQHNVPDQLRGRVMSLYSLCFNLAPLGGLLAGAMAAAVDARFAVTVGGAIVTANALLLLRSQRLRRLGWARAA